MPLNELPRQLLKGLSDAISEVTKEVDPVLLSAVMTRANADNMKDDYRIVGTLFKTIESQMATFSLSEEVKKLCDENKVECVDVSDRFHPNMKMSEVANTHADIFQLIAENPKTMYVISGEELNAIECIDAIACSFSANLSLTSHCGYPPQAILLRGEDFYHIRGIKDDKVQLRQALACMIDQQMECPICLESLGEVLPGGTDMKYGRTPFVCGHMMCAQCISGLKECPICRNTERLKLPHPKPNKPKSNPRNKPSRSSKKRN
jgi:hypothetical protein